MGCMVEMETTRAKFQIWGQHGIPELAGVNLGRGSNLGLNIYKYCCDFIYILFIVATFIVVVIIGFYLLLVIRYY